MSRDVKCVDVKCDRVRQGTRCALRPGSPGSLAEAESRAALKA